MIMWVVRDKDESLWVFKHKPIKNEIKGIWESSDKDYFDIEWADKWAFREVEWENEEPTELILKKGK